MELTEFEGIDLDTDLEAAAEKLGRQPAGAAFVMGQNRFLTCKRKAEDKAARRGIEALIRPENAAGVLQHLPAEDERTHCLLRGDFVLCDLIPTIIQARGPALDVHIATLGLSAANAASLAELKKRGQIRTLTIICSLYFQQVDKATTFREVEATLKGVADLVIERSHAKVICLPTRAGDSYVIEGSANLRSSDNLEQMTVYNDRETLAWHRDWMEELKGRHG
jgi:hypothetical protein